MPKHKKNSETSRRDELWSTGVLIEDPSETARITRERLGWKDATPEQTASAKYATFGNQGKWNSQNTIAQWNVSGVHDGRGAGWDVNTDLWTARALWANNPIPTHVFDMLHPHWQTGVNIAGGSNASIANLVHEGSVLPFANDDYGEISAAALYESKFQGKDPLSNSYALNYVHPELYEQEMAIQKSPQEQAQIYEKAKRPLTKDQYDEHIRKAIMVEGKRGSAWDPTNFSAIPPSKKYREYDEFIGVLDAHQDILEHEMKEMPLQIQEKIDKHRTARHKEEKPVTTRKGHDVGTLTEETGYNTTLETTHRSHQMTNNPDQDLLSPTNNQEVPNTGVWRRVDSGIDIRRNSTIYYPTDPTRSFTTPRPVYNTPYSSRISPISLTTPSTGGSTNTSNTTTSSATDNSSTSTRSNSLRRNNPRSNIIINTNNNNNDNNRI